MVGVGRDGGRHALCDGPVQLWGTRAGLDSQIRQFRTKFVEQDDESLRGGSISRFDLGQGAECLEHDVDGAIVQEEAPPIR